MFRSVLVALMLTVVGGSASADPNPQLVNSVETGLAQYGLHADVSQFATSTVARLHLTLSSPEDYYDTRDELRFILRNAKYKDDAVPPKT
ncbi:MAG: hypothetical protein ACR2O1_03030 [Boseongicola sp.]